MHLTNFISCTGVKSAAGRIWSAPLIDAAVGAGLCALAAVGASMVAAGHSWKNLVPLIFTVILLVIAGIFGARAGILGSIASALIFVTFLFAPGGSFSVASDSARSNLGWMLLIGIAFSFLLAPTSSGYRRH